MANVVEVIFQGTDRTTGPADSASKSVEKVATNTKRQFDIIAKTALAMAAGVVTAFKAIQQFRTEAERLGRVDIVNNIDKMNDALQNTYDILVSIKGPGGKSIADIIGDAAGGAANAANLTALLALQGRLKEIDAQLSGTSTTRGSYGQQIVQDVDPDKKKQLETERATIMEQIKQLAEGKKQSDLNKKHIDDLNRMFALHQAITLSLRQQRSISDAIRAGDARAYKDAMVGAGVNGRAGASPLSSRVNGAQSLNPYHGGATSVSRRDGGVGIHVSIGGQAINDHIRTQVVKTLTDSQRHPGKDQ